MWPGCFHYNPFSFPIYQVNNIPMLTPSTDPIKLIGHVGSHILHIVIAALSPEVQVITWSTFYLCLILFNVREMLLPDGEDLCYNPRCGWVKNNGYSVEREMQPADNQRSSWPIYYYDIRLRSPGWVSAPSTPSLTNEQTAAVCIKR